MKISELIKLLEEAKEKHGDSEVVLQQRKSDVDTTIDSIYFEDYDKNNPKIIISFY